MGMIPQETSEMQESVANVFCGIPAALTSGEKCIYILVKDLDKDLEDFISTGRADRIQLQALPSEEMQAIAKCCERHGLELKHYSQRMEYMHRKVTVAYPQISSPATGMKVSLVPWFTLPDRPYPVFAYIYAIWHYNTSEKKSQRLSAAAAGKVFGIGSFNKSTVCRNLKAMERLSESVQIGSPASAGTARAQTTKEVIGCIPEILKSCPPTESLKEMLGGNVAPIPESANSPHKLTNALDAIPQEYSQVIMETAPAGTRKRDARKRPARPRKQPGNDVQRILRFADSEKIESIRRGFIAACRIMVIDSAAVYHKFVL